MIFLLYLENIYFMNHNMSSLLLLYLNKHWCSPWDKTRGCLVQRMLTSSSSLLDVQPREVNVIWANCTLTQGCQNFVLEGHCPACFSSNLPQHTFLDLYSYKDLIDLQNFWPYKYPLNLVLNETELFFPSKLAPNSHIII